MKIAFAAMLLFAASTAHADVVLPFDMPPGFVLYEDGSYVTADGRTGCLPTWACENTD